MGTTWSTRYELEVVEEGSPFEILASLFDYHDECMHTTHTTNSHMCFVCKHSIKPMHMRAHIHSGADGSDGQNGEKGMEGEQGIHGEKGETGLQGPPGPQGMSKF